MVDYYQILQVDSSANEQEIKRAFRLLAKKYHPDINRHTDAPEKFKLVYMAYEVLSNDFKKRLYDELRLEQETYSTHKANAGFNYDAGFEEWEHRAKRRADHFSKMKYEQFEKEELRGFDFIYHQFALLLGILGLFFIGGGGLYFAKTIFVAVYHEKSPPTSLIGAIISAAFGLIILWYVTKMVGAFKNTFLARFKKSS